MQVGQSKIYRQGLVWLIAAIALYACKKPPEFPVTPAITYERITKTIGYEYNGPRQPYKKTDSVVISLGFQDGDGDLGTEVEGVENYLCEVLFKDSVDFVPIIDTASNIINKNGRFAALNPDGRQGPIEGTLNYGVSIFDLSGTIADGREKYTLKFRVAIKDNAGRISNEIETDPVDIQFY